MTSDNKGYAYSAEEYRITDGMRAVLDTLRDEVLILSRDHEVLLSNARVRERVGDLDTTHNKRYCYNLHVQRHHPCTGDDHRCMVVEVLRTGEIVRMNHLVIDDFGHTILMAAEGTPIRDNRGEITWIVQTLRDIENVQTSTAAQADNRGNNSDSERDSASETGAMFRMDHVHNIESLGALTERIAHDFNNLMVGVLGNTEYLLETVPVDSPIREVLTDIFDAARKAASLAKQMSSYTGKHEFQVSKINVDEIFDVFEHRNAFDSGVPGNIVFRYDLEPDLPPIDGDVVQIRRAVRNLVTNAKEALGSAPGVIRLGTGRIHFDAANAQEPKICDDIKKGEYVYIEVADTGRGMTPEIMKKIFDPRFSTKEKGRGLGLAAVLGIVRNLDGAIEVFSNPGEGSTFRILFPVRDGNTVRPDTDTEWATLPFEGKKALLVDDEEAIREVARYMLEHLGFDVTAASNGADTLKILEGPTDFDLVLLDFTMPEMDGETCFHALRKLKPNLKVVLSSGHSERDMTERFLLGELAGYIQKPYRLEQLRAVLQQALFAPSSSPR